MRKCVCISLVLLLISASGMLFALSLEEILPDLTEKEYEKLREGKILEARTLDGPINQLAPQRSLAYLHTVRMERLAAEHEEKGFSINNISLIPYPEGFENLTFEERQLEIFNTMRAVSTQEGITYISYRRGNEPHPLIRDSWYLEAPRSRGREPDPVVDELPSRAENYVYQRDTSFGGNVYRHQYTITDREIFLDIDNLETMRILSFIRVVDPEELNIFMATYQIDEGLLLYSLANIGDREPRVSFLGIEVHLPSAFNRRITALQEWFVDQLHQD